LANRHPILQFWWSWFVRLQPFRPMRQYCISICRWSHWSKQFPWLVFRVRWSDLWWDALSKNQLRIVWVRRGLVSHRCRSSSAIFCAKNGRRRCWLLFFPWSIKEFPFWGSFSWCVGRREYWS